MKNQRRHQKVKTLLAHKLAELIREIQIFPNAIYIYNTFPIKIPISFYTELKVKILRFI